MRIKNHPILTFENNKKSIDFTYNGERLSGYEGDTIASALQALGIRTFGKSTRLKRPRGLYCAIGNCSSCHMVVNGKPNVKTCITLLKEGMVVETQVNRGVLSDK